MTNDEKKTLLQQRYAELDDESLCALERHKLTEQARELSMRNWPAANLDLATMKRATATACTGAGRPCARGNGAVRVSAAILPGSHLCRPPGPAQRRQSGRHGGPACGCRRPGPGHPRAGLCPAPPLRHLPLPDKFRRGSGAVRRSPALPRQDHCLYLRAIACCPSGANIGPLRQLSFLYKKRGNAMRHFPVAVSCRPQKDVDG